VATGRVIASCYPDKRQYAVIHLEEDRTSLCVYIGENPYILKNIPFGINRIVEKISSNYGITKEKARAILEGKEAGTGEELEIGKDFLLYLTGEINGLVDETTEPEWLFLVGKGFEGTKMYDLAKEGRIWEGTAQGISLVNPLLFLVGEEEEEVIVGKPSQTAAVGLAMRYEGDEDE